MVSKIYALPICQHEVGHYVVSNECGFRTGDIEVTITSHPGYLTHYTHAASSTVHLERAVRGIDEVKEYLQDRIAVLAAGVLCQSIRKNKIDNVKAGELWFHGDAQSDRNKADELIVLLNNILNPEECTQEELKERLHMIFDVSWGKAIAIIESKMEVINEMSEAIFNRIQGYGIKTIVPHQDLEEIRVKCQRD